MAFEKITEQDSLYDQLENYSVAELVNGIHTEDQKVALAVESTPQHHPTHRESRSAIAPWRTFVLYGRRHQWTFGHFRRLGMSAHLWYRPQDRGRFDRGGKSAVYKAVENAEDSTLLVGKTCSSTILMKKISS